MQHIVQILLVAAAVGLAYGSGYGWYETTAEPIKVVTQTYGPLVKGGEWGSGKRSTKVGSKKQAEATGSAYSTDQAEAEENAAKTKEYQYKYR